MRPWRIIENEYNLRMAPWSGAVGIEEIDEEIAVPSIVCWFMRGWDRATVENVVRVHNQRQIGE